MCNFARICADNEKQTGHIDISPHLNDSLYTHFVRTPTRVAMSTYFSDPRGVANLPASKQAYRPAAVLGSQQHNAQADRPWLRQMLSENSSIYGDTPNPPSRSLTGTASDHTDAFALQGDELFFRASSKIDPMGLSRQMQVHRRNPANESISGFTNLRGVNKGRFAPGATPAGQTGVLPQEKIKTELAFVEAEKNVVPMGVIARPPSEADSGAGNTTTHLNAVITMRNNSNVDWPAGALGRFYFPRPWELPQGADIASARTGVRPTAWLLPVDRKTFEWDQRDYMEQSLARVLQAINRAGNQARTLAFWRQDVALTLTAGDAGKEGLILSDETDRVWYHLVAAEALRLTDFGTRPGGAAEAQGVIIVEQFARDIVGSWQRALANQDLFLQTVQRATMALRGLVGKFDSTIICRFLTSAPKGGEAEIYMRS